LLPLALAHMRAPGVAALRRELLPVALARRRAPGVTALRRERWRASRGALLLVASCARASSTPRAAALSRERRAAARSHPHARASSRSRCPSPGVVACGPRYAALGRILMRTFMNCYPSLAGRDTRHAAARRRSRYGGVPGRAPRGSQLMQGCSPLGPSFLSPVLPIQRGFFHDSESKAVDMSPLLIFIGFLHERSSRRQAAVPRACPPEAHVKVGATGSTRLQRDTPDLEDDLGVRSFPPVEIFSFIAASFRGKTSEKPFP
jgi:hypothetical protein